MTRYYETGLPADMKVFSAYTACVCAAGENAQVSGLFAMRAARMLNSHGVRDADTLCLAFLCETPPALHGLMGRRFGAEVAALLREKTRQEQEQFVGVAQASAPIRLLTLATLGVNCEIFLERAEQVERDGGFRPGADVPVLPLNALAQIAGRLRLKTPSRALEEHVDAMIVRCRETLKAQQETLESLGYHVKTENAFAQAGLLDAPVVRAAYDYLMDHADEESPNLSWAMETARMLSVVPEEPDAVIVAAALIDLGLPGRGPEDLQEVSRVAGKEVADLLSRSAVYSGRVPPPGPASQIRVAAVAVEVEMARKTAEGLVESLQATPAAAAVIGKHLRELSETAGAYARDCGLPLVGTTGSRTLDALLVQEMKEFDAFFALHLPKKPVPKPPRGPA